MSTNRPGDKILRAPYCNERVDLNPFAIEELYKFHNKHFYSDLSDLEAPKTEFNGHYLFTLDETEIKVPATAENIEQFGDIRVGNRIECHMRLGAVYDLRNHLIVDAACNPYIYVDRNLAIYEQIKSIPEYIGVDHPYITVLDSSCESLPLIVRLLASGKKFAVMLKNNGFFEDELHSMRADDEDIVINPVRYRSEFISETDEPYMRSHAWAFRIVTVWYKGQRASLATNLSREEFPQEAFRELYNLRWGDKAGFRHLQKRLQIKQFTGTRCATLLQDIFGIIYIANTAEDVARDYAELAGLDLTFIDCVQSRLVNRLIDFATLKNDLIYALLVDSEEKSEVMTKLYQDIEDRIKQGIKG